MLYFYYTVIADTEVDVSLSDRHSRQMWENEFATTFIKPMCDYSSTILDAAHAAIIGDNNLGKHHNHSQQRAN